MAKSRAESNEEIGTLGTIVYYLGLLWMIGAIVQGLGAVACAGTMTTVGGVGAGGPGAAAGAVGGMAVLPLVIVAVITFTAGYLVKTFAYKVENGILSLVGQLKDA